MLYDLEVPNGLGGWEAGLAARPGAWETLSSRCLLEQCLAQERVSDWLILWGSPLPSLWGVSLRWEGMMCVMS